MNFLEKNFFAQWGIIYIHYLIWNHFRFQQNVLVYKALVFLCLCLYQGGPIFYFHFMTALKHSCVLMFQHPSGLLHNGRATVPHFEKGLQQGRLTSFLNVKLWHIPAVKIFYDTNKNLPQKLQLRVRYNLPVLPHYRSNQFIFLY